MTTASRWDMTDTVTLWPTTGYDVYSTPTYGSPVTVSCSWQSGGRLTRDDTGAEFVPSSTVWIEAGSGAAVGWKLKVGTFTGSVPDDAEVIRRVNGWNNNTVGWGAADVALVTG